MPSTRAADALNAGRRKSGVQLLVRRAAGSGATVLHVSKLVIVESPNKVKSIAGYLGDEYVVDSSVGHIRDLPRGADEVPAQYQGQPWARLGVNIDERFEPIYVVSAEKKGQI